MKLFRIFHPSWWTEREKGHKMLYLKTEGWCGLRKFDLTLMGFRSYREFKKCFPKSVYDYERDGLFLKCPHCGGRLKYNMKLGSKYVCQRCSAIWTYNLNLFAKKIEWYEWFVTDKPARWDKMSRLEKMRFLNADRLAQSAGRFIIKDLNY